MELAWSDDSVIFRVKDTGKEVPEEARPFVFDRFYRVDQLRNSQIPGSGLGLSIPQEIIAMHQGRLWVDGNGEKGRRGPYFHFPFLMHIS
jgi:signal transduction histidine kinase